MLFIRLKVSSLTIYDKLAAGMISIGKGTLSHCIPPFANTSILPQLLSQRRLYMLASVKLYLYSPPRKPLNPVVWLMVNTGASWFTGTRLCFVFMKVSPGANLNSRCASVVLIFPCPIWLGEKLSFVVGADNGVKYILPHASLPSVFMLNVVLKPHSCSYSNDNCWRL